MSGTAGGPGTSGFAGLQQPCPCGGGVYDGCCGRFHRGEAAPTPELLMRSRYAAYALGHDDYVFRTWHPRTRPDDVATDPGLTWTRLDVLGAGTASQAPASLEGALAADEEWVEFAAHYRYGGIDRVLHERSRFARRGGRWVYVAPITLA